MEFKDPRVDKLIDSVKELALLVKEVNEINYKLQKQISLQQEQINLISKNI